MNGKSEIKALRARGWSSGTAEGAGKGKRGVSAVVKALVELGNAARAHSPARHKREAQRRLDKLAVSPSNHCLVIMKGTPRKSNARAKIGLVRITKSIGNPSLFGRQ